MNQAENRPHIRLEQRDTFAIVYLDNPPMNVVSLQLTRELFSILKSLEADDSVRSVILTGAGDKAFCAGSDIHELQDMRAPGQVLEKKLIFQNKTFELLRSFPKPTIAALNGYTYGGGLEIACCCDLLIAEEHIKLALPEIKLGVFPSSGGTFRVARKIGEARAKQMIFLGQPISAETANTWGLVNFTVPQGTALREACEMAEILGKSPQLALSKAKSIINLAFDRSDSEAIGESLLASDKVFASRDAAEGVNAFLEKRPAQFNA